MSLGNEGQAIEGIDAFRSVAIGELEMRASAGECLGTPEQAHIAAVSMALDVVSQADTPEALRFNKLLTPLEEDPWVLSMRSFVGHAALLMNRYRIHTPNGKHLVLDASNPLHFPLAIKHICALAHAGEASKSMTRHIKRATAVVQIAANHALRQEDLVAA